MKQYLVSIPEEEEAFFIKLMKSINFIDFTTDNNPYDIPESHKAIVRERIVKYGSDKNNYLSREAFDGKIKSRNRVVVS